MKQTAIRLGPLALLLTVISICLTILAILTVTTARADLRLAEKYAETVKERTALETQGQELVRAVTVGEAGTLAPDADGTIRAELEQNGLRLRLALSPDGEGGWAVTDWRMEKEWTFDDTIDGLWSGSFGKEG